MKATQIVVGGIYIAKVSNKLTRVRVARIYKGQAFNHKEKTYYDVTNLTTNRKTIFHSAAKFRSVAKDNKPIATDDKPGDKQCSDPTLRNCEPIGEKQQQSIQPTGVGISKEPVNISKQDCLALADTNLNPHQMVTNPTLSQEDAGVQPVCKPETKPSLGSVLKKEANVSSFDGSHLVIEARAGTGKTTTLVEGLKRIKGIPVNIIPSPQQATIWEQMETSKDARSICFVAFNKAIATELQQRVPKGCDAMTMHSLGYRAVIKMFGRQDVNSYVVQDHISSILNRDIRDLRRDPAWVVAIKAVEELVGQCKKNLTGPASTNLWALASHYMIDMNGQSEKIFDLVAKVLEKCKSPNGKIDFDDMIWLPVILKLSVFQYDVLLVDEAQDLNRCQQALAKIASKRLILCGDPKQAIYGFAGADCESMSRMEKELAETPRGCLHLPLTVTRRCGKNIVREANNIVAEFSAYEDNPEGIVSRAAYPNKKNENGNLPEGLKLYSELIRDGDMALCRVNAPLVSQCLRFIKDGRKAVIQGRDIGQGLISTINKMKAESIICLIEKLSYWLSSETSKEQAKKNPNENKLIALQDRYDCLCCFCEGSQTVEEVIRKVENVFTDDKTTGIKFSSIHKAKGLEAKRIFFLLPKGAGCPHPMAKTDWAIEQEMNLKYVAITRAIEELVYVY